VPRKISKCHPFRQNDNDTFYSVRLKNSKNVWKTRSLGTDSGTRARLMAEMIDKLRESGDIAALVRVADREPGWTMDRVWTAYRAKEVSPAKGPSGKTTHDARAARLNEALKTAALDPLVAEWNGGLTASAPYYLRQVRRLIPAGSKMALHELTREALFKFFDALRVGTITGEKIGPASRDRHRTAISQFVEWMIDERSTLGIETNFVLSVPIKWDDTETKAARKRKHVFVYYKEPEVRAIIEKAPAGSAVEAMVALMFGGGVELDVVTQLSRKHFFGPVADWGGNVFHAEGNKNDERDRRGFIIVPWCIPIVRAYVAKLELENGGKQWWFLPRAAPTGNRKKGPVERYQEKVIGKAFFAACAAAGVARVPGRKFHKFRHALTEWGKDNGIPPHVISMCLGHAPGSQVTLGVYGRADRQDELGQLAFNAMVASKESRKGGKAG
jgi:integrase